MRWRYVLPLLVSLTTACSPMYALRSAKGHAGLLWRRQNIAKALKNPELDEDLRRKLALVQDIRRFGFEKLALARSRDYTTYSPVAGKYLTWLVTASPRLKLEAYLWRFPLAGAYPYKGHYRERDARAEADALERNGFDAYVRGVTAYNTPLWISDPLPTSALDGSPGDLAELLLHELTHGTVYFKGQTEFDENLASFVSERGAAQFLAERFGKGSIEAEAFRESLERQRRFDAGMDALRRELAELYASGESAQEKLTRRDAVFESARGRFAEDRFPMKTLNNAVVVAHGVYRERGDAYLRALESVGGDWKAFFTLMSSLNKKAPLVDLEKRLGAR